MTAVSRVDLADPDPRLCVVVLGAGLVLIGLADVWAFLSMRVVMGVGGACADGGPYVSAQSCPDGSGLIVPAVYLMLIGAFASFYFAAKLEAPNVFLVFWATLFGALGWNFWEYGLTADPGGWVWGWVICGALFWLMAAPALFLMVRLAPGAGLSWWPRYAVALAVGGALGAWTYDAIV